MTAPDPAGAGGPAALAEIASRGEDQAFLKRLYVDGDQAAAREWQELHKRAHPQPGEPEPIRRADGVLVPAPSYYPLHDVPADLAPGVKAAAAGMRLTAEEADALARACAEGEQVCRSLDDPGDESLRADTLARLGGGGVGDAQRAFAALRRASPDLARRIEDTGAGNHPKLVAQLAAIGARSPR